MKEIRVTKNPKTKKNKSANLFFTPRVLLGPVVQLYIHSVSGYDRRVMKTWIRGQIEVWSEVSSHLQCSGNLPRGRSHAWPPVWILRHFRKVKEIPLSRDLSINLLYKISSGFKIPCLTRLGRLRPLTSSW